jgi:hypothetical protein
MMNILETNKRDVFAFIILAMVTALSYTPSAFACPCPEISDPLTSLKQSTAVFSGKVLKIDEDGDRSPLTGTSMRKVHFRVDKAWKGIERIMIRVNTEKDTTACGYKFSTGNEYLVYTSGERGNLQVSLCSRTQKLIDVSAEELATLGEPTFLPEDEDFPLFNLISDHPIPSILVLAALAGLAFHYLLQKFKRHS